LAPLPSDVSPQVRVLADRALSGDPLAQHDLANQYAVGETVPQSNSSAAYWYGLAAEAGIANAQYNLGVLTTRGLGVRKDLERAFQLFQDAAEAGHADAQTALGLAFANGLGVQQDRLQAASWFQAASTNGRPRGAYHLGQLFESGLDEDPDLAAAAGWYRIAADAGYGQAREALERVTAAIRPAPAPTPSTGVAAPTTTPTPVPPSPAPIRAQPSELVREIQQLLNEFGYPAGQEDGRLGRQTVEAIRAFQRSQGLYATGDASTGLRDLLKILAGRS
jgi:TPR repeat protein